MSCELQNQAYLNLFLAIVKENGYYTELRKKFIKQKGYNMADLASMLYSSYDDAPDGMSPYWYMDSLENTLAVMSKKEKEEIEDIDDLVETVYDKMTWRE